MSKDIADAAFAALDDQKLLNLDDFIDYDQQFEAVPDDVELREVAALGAKLRDLTKVVLLREAELLSAQQDLRKLVEDTLPSRMFALGLTSLSLDDGTSIKVVTDVYTSISTANRVAAMIWLRENNFGDLIKNQVVVTLGKSEDQAAQDLTKWLSESGFRQKFVVKEDVHPGTLKAFVKEQIEAGKPVPENIFSVYRVSRAKIGK